MKVEGDCKSREGTVLKVIQVIIPQREPKKDGDCNDGDTTRLKKTSNGSLLLQKGERKTEGQGSTGGKGKQRRGLVRRRWDLKGGANEAKR